MIYGNEVYSLDAVDGSYGVRKFIYNPTTQKLTESKKIRYPCTLYALQLDKGERYQSLFAFIQRAKGIDYQPTNNAENR